MFDLISLWFAVVGGELLRSRGDGRLIKSATFISRQEIVVRNVSLARAPRCDSSAQSQPAWLSHERISRPSPATVLRHVRQAISRRAKEQVVGDARIGVGV